MTWAGHLPASREYRRILVGLGAAGVATFAQLYSPQGLLPTLARGLEVSPAEAALSVSLATLGVALAVLPWSWVADRVGRLRAMQVAIVASTVLGVLVALAPDIEALLALRLVEGMALGGLPALAVTYLHDEVHARHTAAAAAAYISGTTIGGAAGRLIAGPLAGLVGWRPALLTVAAVCAVASVVFLRLMPRPRGYRPTGASVRTVTDGIRTSLRDPALLALYAQGALLMGGFVGVYNYLAFRLEGAEFGLPATVGSLIFAAYAAGTVSSRLTGRWVPLLGRRRVLVGGTLTMALGALLTLSSSLAVVVVGLLVLTAGFFAAHATASAWVGARATTGRAQATALYNVLYYSGSALVGWLLGYAWSGPGWGAVVGAVVALAALAAGIAVVVLPGRSPARAGVTPPTTADAVHAVPHERRSGGGTT
ncbi:MFS transporter [Terrabacter aerolatus]|uniref:MFS transporter n=1 Tax=Terrabacter aerolatus TaxID=422442 RepID=A0A512CWH4_9MICO|nr:MFS transporter [Terrabacter aerolatus]GEO28581.1 MFS transporter [Terrabacter aerolatus]